MFANQKELDMAGKIPPHRALDTAAFVYFDIVAAYGTLNGAIQVELASRTLRPEGAETIIEFVTTAHLRCSPAAAAALHDALGRAIEMLKLPQTPQPVSVGQLN